MRGRLWRCTTVLGYPRVKLQCYTRGFTTQVMDDSKPIKLKVPTQDQTELRIFPGDSASAANWMGGLPPRDPAAVVENLDEALADLNRTTLPPTTRYEILETLAPALDSALASLKKRFLNQPLVLPAEPRAMARACDQLMSAATTAYAVVAIEAVQKSDSITSTNPARLTCEAIQRALLYSGLKILQAYQLHQPMEPDTWAILHQLYALAEFQRLADLPIPDARAGGSTIKATYAQALALSCCKPNQLRQSDLMSLYRGLQAWVGLLRIESREHGNELFVVDLNGDRPAQYRALHRDADEEELRAIDTSVLIQALETRREALVSKGDSFDKATGVPLAMVEHLIACLGSVSMRNFKRTASNSPLWICLGLGSAHYQVSQQHLMHRIERGDRYVAAPRGREDDNVFNSAADDDHQEGVGAHPPSGDGQQAPPGVNLDVGSRAMIMTEEEHAVPQREAHPIFEVQLADTGPNGYCLEWLDDIPADLRSGDIVGLKEDREQNEWAIAVIRWLSRLRNARTLVGLELLSPRAVAFGGRLARKGKAEEEPPIRVLLLPEIKIVGQPSTLITPRARFKERQKLILRNAEESRTIQLMRQISSTASFEQFEFHPIKELGDPLAERENTGADMEYDSLWSNI